MQETGDTALNEIFEKIRVAVFKNGIRTTEFFRDHDKLRSGIVTESQFKCGLSLAVGKEAQLSRAEIQKVVEYYRVSDDRVQYREFCNMMENGENSHTLSLYLIKMPRRWGKKIVLPLKWWLNVSNYFILLVKQNLCFMNLL